MRFDTAPQPPAWPAPTALMCLDLAAVKVDEDEQELDLPPAADPLNDGLES